MLEKLFPDLDTQAMLGRLRKAGAPYGINFNEMKKISNSKLALEASEFAREHGKFEEFHDNVFQAYFLNGKDIGEIKTILDIAGETGLAPTDLEKSLQEGVYTPRLVKSRELGGEFQVTGLPAFIINGKKKIVGAQQYEAFTRAINEFL